MIKKIKSIINEFRANNKQILLRLAEIENQNRELEWSQIYHDSIRGKEWIEKLPLNVGRWAGNYSFFYVLNRILSDYKPTSILDLGLGESSKFISAYLKNYLLESNHTVVEQSKDWIDMFLQNNSLSSRSNIIFCPIKEVEIKGHISNSYDGFDEKITKKFDLYIVDGPFGSERFSRYNIISVVEKMVKEDEFIIIMDDTNRRGERDTLNKIKECLNLIGINFYLGEYIGNKAVTVIVTKKYKYAISM